MLVAVACGDDANPAKDPDAATSLDTPPLPPDGGVDPVDPVEMMCERLPPTTSGTTCEVTGSGSAKLIKGNILTPTTMFRGGQVAVDAGGAITCVGCNCAQGNETVITCPEAAVSPGLINTHDHITFTQNNPYNDTGERYDDRQQWRRGQDGHTRISSSGGASADQIRWGELRFLMGGATSIVGSGGQPGILRNLDQAANQEGLSKGVVNFDTFPLDDSGGTKRNGDCNYGGSPTTAAQIANDLAYEPHTAEGLNATARNEFLCESSETFDTTAPGLSNNLLLSKTAMIHAIGLQPADYGAMAAAGTGLIWSPRSNVTLYGDTAKVTTAARMGVEIALGTDWMPTGSMNVLRELKCAASLNETYYNRFFTDAQLWQMVTLNAASVTSLDDTIGLLAPGRRADIAIFKGNGKTYRAVIDAEPQDVALVLRSGTVLYGDAVVVNTLGGPGAPVCDTVDVCGTGKRVCLQREIGKSLATLTANVGANMYPAFACGTPQNEPSCVPRRPKSVAGSTIYTGEQTATDSDGDGIPDAVDKCPNVFDPIRPVDAGKQPDADNDGVGDACDPCPLDANTTTCTVADPNDRDHDGVPNSIDNCPDVANPDQLDSDGDGKGDACDACPNVPNPGAAGCPATIYSIKMGTTPIGTTVRVVNALVTGKGSNGFFVQVKEGDAGYLGPDFSGMFVFTGANAPTLAMANVGSRVTIDGRVANFQNQIELDTVTAVVATATGVAPPAAIDVTIAQVKTGGTKALAYESMLVRITQATTVTANNAMFGEYTLTAGADQIIGDDFLFLPSPLPPPGQNFTTVTGIIALRQMVNKIEPRSAADLTAGAPSIASFSPELSFARVNVTTGAPTFPTSLKVTLTGPAQGDTTVVVTSGNAALTVANVVIPNGQTTGTVNVTANAQNPDVAVTAMLGMQMVTSHVRVLGELEDPTTVTLSPATAAVAPSGTIDYTVTLDVPARVATQVALSTTSGTVPATVTVDPGQVSATFTYQNAGMSATVSASFNGTTSNSAVTVSTGANHLVINEVDYDQIGADTAEYIEIYNPSTQTISLAGKLLLLVNGNGGAVYDTIDLASAGSLAAGQYLVIAGANVTVPASAKKLDPGWVQDRIQNGSPDGIALIDNVTHTLIDVLSYEGSMTNIDLPGFPAPVSLVEGTATNALDSNTVVQSMCRSPNGQDTDNAMADWKVCTTLTPGTANP
ncbi:MAG: amidohydrolase family protein [Deltaproteobacteria bacterium]|nr:amidohydrolase family protein [Deltaproteobacteria bacterium]